MVLVKPCSFHNPVWKCNFGWTITGLCSYFFSRDSNKATKHVQFQQKPIDHSKMLPNRGSFMLAKLNPGWNDGFLRTQIFWDVCLLTDMTQTSWQIKNLQGQSVYEGIKTPVNSLELLQRAHLYAELLPGGVFTWKVFPTSHWPKLLQC